jgi:hypothetical protein
VASGEYAAQRREHRGRGSVAKALVVYADAVQPRVAPDRRERRFAPSLRRVNANVMRDESDG